MVRRQACPRRDGGRRTMISTCGCRRTSTIGTVSLARAPSSVILSINSVRTLAG
jgi:hypothetical protein